MYIGCAKIDVQEEYGYRLGGILVCVQISFHSGTLLCQAEKLHVHLSVDVPALYADITPRSLHMQ